MKKVLLSLTLTFGFLLSATAVGAIKKAGNKKIGSTLADTGSKYRSAKQVSMNLQKTVISSLLGKEKNYEGKIDIGGPLFRLENTKPDRSLIIFDGKSLWNVQMAGGGNSSQVARAKIDKKNQSQILVATLLSNRPIQDQLKIEKEIASGDTVKYETQPKSADWGIQDLRLSINKKSLIVTQIEYKDDLGNETKLYFSNVRFLQKLDKNIFKYSPPKGVQVIEL